MKRVLSMLLALVMMMGLLYAGPGVTAQDTGSKLIAITFDDGPGPYTARLLDGLKARGAKATFFMVGYNIANYPDLVARAYNEGHQIANHSSNHADLTTLSAAGVSNNIQSVNNMLDKACGTGTKYMVRAPYGSFNRQVSSAVGAPLVMWSVDTLDWKYRNSETVKNNILRDAFDGAIVLLHDIHSTTIGGALAALDVLKSRGYEFVTVRELFRRRGRSFSNGISYYSSSPNGADLGAVAAPEITWKPEAGKLRVTITGPEGAAIYYSTDGSAIKQTSAKYTGPFLVNAPCKLKAVAAYDLNGSRSETAEAAVAKPLAQEPAMRVEDGMLALSCSSPGATIYYALHGAQDSHGTQTYTGPVPIAPGTTAYSYAAGENYLSSAQAKGFYSPRKNFFRDVFPGQWYYEDMDRAAASGLLTGLGSGVFAPGDPVTRAQLAVLLHRLSGEEAPEGSGFPDVSEGKYYAPAVRWAQGAGIVQGDQNGNFQPERPVTRQELCKICYDYLLRRGAEAPEASAGLFADEDFIVDWAREAAGAMAVWGLVNGNAQGEFEPLGACSRSQSAAVLVRMSDFMDNLPEKPQEPDEPEPSPEPEGEDSVWFSAGEMVEGEEF